MTVYCLAADDQVSETYCAYSVRVGDVNVTFYKVSSTVMRENSVRAYFDVHITVKVGFFCFFLVFVSCFISVINSSLHCVSSILLPFGCILSFQFFGAASPWLLDAFFQAILTG